MDSNENPISVPPQEDLPDLTEVKKPTSLLVAQFFLFPLIIIAFGVGIFVLFGYMAYEERSPEAYLSQIRNGRGSSVLDRRMWQAAAELTNVIAVQADELRDTEFAGELLETYIDARPALEDTDNPIDPASLATAMQVRRFLAMSIGHLGDVRAIPALTVGLSDPDAETRIWTMWALGEIADPSAAPAVVELLDGPDAGVRQMAAYVLGALKNPMAIQGLQITLNDVAPDVRWTAAMSLAQLGDASGSELLVLVTDREYFADFAEMSEEDKETVITNAVHCLGLLQLDGARDHLLMLSTEDPSLKVRDAAIAALKLY